VRPSPLSSSCGYWANRFLVDRLSRDRYDQTLLVSLATDGLLVIATFALDEPEQCTELPLARHDAVQLEAALGKGFVLIDERRKEYPTPTGSVQLFTVATFRRDSW